MSTHPKPVTIEEYIHSFPEETQNRLNEIRRALRSCAPDATENLKWGHPALSYDWILFQFAAFKKHVSLYPTPSVIRALKNELVEYTTSDATVQFPLNKPIPEKIIERIAAQRLLEAKNGVKWM